MRYQEKLATEAKFWKHRHKPFVMIQQEFMEDTDAKSRANGFDLTNRRINGEIRYPFTRDLLRNIEPFAKE